MVAGGAGVGSGEGEGEGEGEGLGLGLELPLPGARRRRRCKDSAGGPCKDLSALLLVAKGRQAVVTNPLASTTATSGTASRESRRAAVTSGGCAGTCSRGSNTTPGWHTS